MGLFLKCCLSWISSLRPSAKYPSANTEAPSLALLPIHLQYLSWWQHLRFAYHPFTNEDRWVTTSVTSRCQAPSSLYTWKLHPIPKVHFKHNISLSLALNTLFPTLGSRLMLLPWSQLLRPSRSCSRDSFQTPSFNSHSQHGLPIVLHDSLSPFPLSSHCYTFKSCIYLFVKFMTQTSACSVHLCLPPTSMPSSMC